MKTNNYKKLILMLVISFVVMYSTMFLNIYSTDTISLSMTRLYMALLMVTPMAVIMLLFMPMMYGKKKLNRLIFSAATIIFVVSLFFLRNQVLVSDEQYLKAMIPHHSSAIMTSTNAQIQDPEVKVLSDKIIKSQNEEIAQMKKILNRLEK